MLSALYSPQMLISFAGTGVNRKGRNEIQLNHEFTHGTIPIDSSGITAPKRSLRRFQVEHFADQTYVSCARMPRWPTRKRNCKAIHARKIRDEPSLPWSSQKPLAGLLPSFRTPRSIAPLN